MYSKLFSKEISVLAGNPKVEFGADGKLVIDPQLEAFEEAMRVVDDTRDGVSKIVVLFDHPGVFKKQFIDPDLQFPSNKKRKHTFKHMKMNYLLPEIRQTYQEIAMDHGVGLDQISVLTEDLCRLDILSQELSSNLHRACFSQRVGCDSGDECDEKVNCTAIVAATIHYLAKGVHEDIRLVTCWQFDPIRVKPDVVNRGTALAYRMFSLQNALEQRMLLPTKDGSIYRHKLFYLPTEDDEKCSITRVPIELNDFCNINIDLAEGEHPLEYMFDFKEFKLKYDALSIRQQSYGHLLDPRFFEGGENIFRKYGSALDYSYETPVDLEEELFELHPFMDPSVLEQGNVRRFPAGVNEKYISEKYHEDKWVSEGNNELALQLESYIEENLDMLRAKERIKLVDVGPCGGAITTLFALRALHKYGLLDKVELFLLDIVPNVLEATLLGKFSIPQAMIDEYGLDNAGNEGASYRDYLGRGCMHGVEDWYQGGARNPFTMYTEEALKRSNENVAKYGNDVRVHYFRGDGESIPEAISECDIVLSGYVHHHLNLVGRRELCKQMVQAACGGGFIGVADFYVPTYKDYMEWYGPHFKKYEDAPPVECPLIDGEMLGEWMEGALVSDVKNIERSFVLCAQKSL